MDTTHTSRLAVIAAASCVAFWAAKGVAIGVAGGLDRSALEGPFFLLGLTAQVAAVVLLGLTLTSGRAVPVRVLGVLGVMVAGVGLDVATAMALESVRPAEASWVWSEVNLWFGAVLILAVAVAVALRRRAEAA